MTISHFNISFQQAEKLLKNINFLRQRGVKSINDAGVSAEFKSASQKQGYIHAYTIALKNQDFDFLLPDESFFQFEFKPNKKDSFQDIRFAFFQNPREFKTYGQYIEMLREQDILEGEREEEIGDMFYEEYEQFSLEQQININASTIRYDVDFNSYRPLVHSVAHLHIGHQNDIRIPCNKILTPLKFVLFVLKHFYYHDWKGFIEAKNPYIKNELSIEKENCPDLIAEQWVESERQELFIG